VSLRARIIAAMPPRLRALWADAGEADTAGWLRAHRRAVLGGGAALVALWEVWPRRAGRPVPLAAGQADFGPWLAIDGAGMVILSVPQLEMGQGIGTVLARVAAAELGADIARIALQPAPPDEVWLNLPLTARWAALWGGWAARLGIGGTAGWQRHWAAQARFDATADGTGLLAYEAPLRRAAARARGQLAMAAAARWGVPAGDCRMAGGVVRHGARQLGFGALAAQAARLTPPDPPPLGTALAADLAGPPLVRLDAPAKADGSFQFAGDIRLPDMVFAAIRHAPAGDHAALAAWDKARAARVPGALQVVPGEGWLAAVGETWWAAEQALAAIAPTFSVHRPAETLHVEAALEAALTSGAAYPVATRGNAPGDLPLRARYDIAAAIPAGIETASATARWRPALMGGRLDLWVATQAPEQTRIAVARALGIAVADVILIPVAAGGSFDARLETPHAIEAAQIARAVGKPVQLTWSRWQEALCAVARPPVAAEVAARLDDGGNIAAWHLRAATPAAARAFGARLFDGVSRAQARAATATLADPLALEGADVAYAVPDVRIEHVPADVGLTCGRLRGNAHGWTAFVTECFIDEIAAGLHREPLSFRMGMLGGDPRLAACLQRVSALSGWNGGADGSGNGLACHRMGGVADGGCIAAVATARREGNVVKVDRIFAVADVGRIVDADIARQQIEGGLIFGIGLALGCAPTWARGLPAPWRIGEQGLPAWTDCPEVSVALMPSDAPPFDPGELGVAVAAPAIANALFSATGARLRRLPLSADEE